MESLNIQGHVVTAQAGDEYTKAIHRNSDLSILNARYVVYPVSFSDIPTILNVATSQSPPLEIAVKGGGIHTSTWASSEGGLVIDLAKLNKVTLSEDKQSVSVQGGAVWGDVYEVCKEANVDVVGGPLWFVGVGGFILGGGYGPMSGEHGLTVDNMLAAVVVLADGRIVKTSATEEADLFWAIRGGGNQFGIVVEFTLKTVPPAGPFTIGSIIYPGSEIEHLLKILQEWKASQTGKERLSIMFARPGPHFKPAIIVLPWVAAGSDAEKVLSPFRNGLAKPVMDKITTVPDMLTVSHAGDAQLTRAPRRLTLRGTFISDLWTDMVLEVWERWCRFTENEDVRGAGVMWDVTKPDKIASIGGTEMALHVRDPHYWMAVQGRSDSPAADKIIADFVASTASYVREENTKKTKKDLGVFISMAQGDEDIEDIFGENLPRLRKLKAKYDPGKLWCKGCLIEPDFS